MTNEEMKLIADAHGWESHSSGFVYTLEGERMAQSIRQEGWRLTDAGAFRVAVEGGLDFCASNGNHFDAGELEWGSFGTIHSTSDSPHEAVAQARLKQLRSE